MEPKETYAIQEQIPLLVSREEWGANPPKVISGALTLPAEKVLLTIEEGDVAPPCRTSEDCVKSVRLLQEHYMKKGCWDIPYNFVIGNDGKVYEGRGWNRKPQKASKYDEYEDKTVDIAILSGFFNLPQKVRKELEEQAMEFTMTFIKDSVNKRHLDPDHDITGFSGKNVY